MEQIADQIAQKRIAEAIPAIQKAAYEDALRNLLAALEFDVETVVQMNVDGDYGIPVPDYVEENVSSKVVKLIQSYTGVVNKMVWRKF